MRLVKIKSIKKIQSKSKRFDIQTKKNNNFIANGILVHNSLMTLYHYRNEWHVQSSGTADAGGSVNGAMIEWRENGKLIMPFPKDFAAYFWQIVNNTGMNLAQPLWDKMCCVPTDLCFMFEMMGPLNRIIVNHKIGRLVLLGARNINTGEELTPSDAACLLPGKVEVVQKFPLSNLDEIVSTFDDMNPVEQEGYVVVDSSFNRIKIKCPAYVALHYAKGEEVTPKILLKIAVAGENDEWVAHFDKYKVGLLEIRLKLERLIVELCEDYIRITKEIGPDGTQKDFALLAVNTTRCSGALFQHRAGKCSIRHYVRNIA
ncbi:hypothetical protein LCGC14_1401810, partial [marine sediment metagenome]